MASEKRLQVFISSTYIDLKEERQAAVEAILSAGHIPAGMELFAAGDQSQMTVIRRWIEQSDVFMLILGGRYGSIDAKSGKSYIQLEYEYALELGKPLFSVVIEDKYLEEKVKKYGLDVIERDNTQKLKQFKGTVMSRMVAHWGHPRDIELEIHKALRSLATGDLVGWLRGDEVEKVRAEAAQRIGDLEKQILLLDQKVKSLAAQEGKFSGEQIDEPAQEEGRSRSLRSPASLQPAFELALGNITKYGDTDVFPFPIENFVFFDRQAEAVKLLDALHRQSPGEFRRSLGGFMHEEGLVAAGYNGFRWAAQLDPLWNAYLLGLVVAIGSEIEKARVVRDKGIVFSYRFEPDLEQKTLFDREVGWLQFQLASLELSPQYTHVLVCDIADYYLHINQRHLHNALKRVDAESEIPDRIMQLLQLWSKGVGYGLPVGGPAARLLSELLLNDVDRLLLSAQVTFHRFVDDYHIFARSEKEARSHLALLSRLLLVNDALPLQKSKTRILSVEEFRTLHDPSAADDSTESLDRHILRLRLHFDPYSPTRKEDYRVLKEEMSKYPIEEMLARQMRKSRIDQAVTKKLIQMVKFQEPAVRNHAIASLLDNLARLYPVFPAVMILIKGVLPELEEGIKKRVFTALRALIMENSHLVRVPANLAFAVRVLASDSSDDTVQVLSGLYQSTESMMLRRDIILALARNDVDYWTSAHLRDFDRATPWERRALLIASYTLGDEGRDFRRSVDDYLQPMERLVSSWAADRLKRGLLEIPL